MLISMSLSYLKKIEDFFEKCAFFDRNWGLGLICSNKDRGFHKIIKMLI